MVENGYVTAEAGEKAKAEPLSVNAARRRPEYHRRRLFRRRSAARAFGPLRREEALRRRAFGARHARSQDAAHGAQARWSMVSCATTRRMASAAPMRPSTSARIGVRPLANMPALGDVAPWRLAVVLDGNDARSRIGLQPEARAVGRSQPRSRDRDSFTAGRRNGRGKARRVAALEAGDVIYAEPLDGSRGEYRLRQIPEVAARSSRWTRSPAASSPWSADFPSTSRNSTARPRRCASPAPPSSRSSMRRRSTTAIRRPRSSSTSRSRSIKGNGLGMWTAGKFRRQVRAARIRCATPSNIRSTR